MRLNVFLAVATVFSTSFWRASFALCDDLSDQLLNPQTAFELLCTDLVRKEVELTPDQARAVEGLKTALATTIQDWGNKYVKLSPEDRKKMPTLDQVAKPIERRLREVLRPAQLSRLQEVIVQVYGTDIFQVPEVLDLLRVSNEQRRMMSSILNGKSDLMQKLFVEERLDKPQIRSPESTARQLRIVAKKQAIETSTLDQALGALTEEQKMQVKKLRGKEIDLKALEEQRTGKSQALIPTGNDGPLRPISSGP